MEASRVIDARVLREATVRVGSTEDPDGLLKQAGGE